MSTQQDLYGILGVPKTAEPAEIRSAYKKKALSCHPDKEPNEDLKVIKQEQFQRLLTAYETLSDPSKRAKFDERMRILEERIARHPTGVPRNPNVYKSRTSVPPQTTDPYAHTRAARTRQHSPFSPGRSAPEDNFEFTRVYNPERHVHRQSSHEKTPQKTDKWRDNYDDLRPGRVKEEKLRRKADDAIKRDLEEKEKKEDVERSDEKMLRKTKERERMAKEAAKRLFDTRKSFDGTKVRSVDRKTKKEQRYHDDIGSDLEGDFIGSSPKAEKKKPNSKEKRSHSAPRTSVNPDSIETDWSEQLKQAQSYITERKKKTEKSANVETPAPRRTRRMSGESPRKSSHRKSQHEEAFIKPTMSRGATFPTAASYSSPPKLHRSATMENDCRTKPAYRNSPRIVEEDFFNPNYMSFPRGSREPDVPIYHTSPMYTGYEYPGMSMAPSWPDPHVATTRRYTNDDVQYSNQYPTDYTDHYA
ncbi:DnaJ subfamily C member 17 -like protein [Ceratocystis fimbriata CBS 114723]|uniref:DnaJ subfamily C member 17-like protein n=1 Tax=Ceratocystis fimbriata CBS 114723 TaxID=1035309 RepID=A0A2C5WZT1_9PEZI|nr:DnaJ subfamily C member 17 -like protein [Ceratocystis fimbriata CBS 114723]